MRLLLLLRAWIWNTGPSLALGVDVLTVEKIQLCGTELYHWTEEQETIKILAYG